MAEREKTEGNQINISGNNNQLSNINQTVNHSSSQDNDLGINTDAKRKLEHLVSEDKLDDAINLLQNIDPDETQNREVCILLLRRLRELNISKAKGAISKADYHLEKNQIATAILQMLALF